MQAYETYLRERELLIEKGLYNPEDEVSACGVGLVTEIENGPSRRVVTSAVSALKALWHRGAVDADGKTGDGAGVLLEIPHDFFAQKVSELGFDVGDFRIAVGMIFLPRTDIFAQEQCRTVVESELFRRGLKLFGWRQVPVGLDCIGEKAAATRPEVEQIIVGADKSVSVEELERRLFIARKTIENRVRIRMINDFYICSLSSRSIIYKGLFLAEHLTDFYPDLNDESFVARYALYHQRYSTNTFPQWALAQPFRCLAHNGEINTLRSNINWLRVQREQMASKEFADHKDVLDPVVPKGSSDSAALDAVFELLVRSGRTAPMAKSIMIPEAWRKNRKLQAGLADFYTYCNALTKPWDGPAAIVACDGDWVIAGLDRSGLRPLRYARTEDGLLIVGSEAGMVRLEEDQIIEKGRLNPGQMIGVNLSEKSFLKDQEIKSFLCKRRPYHNYVSSFKSMERPKNVKENYEETIGNEKKFLFGYTLEQIESTLMPMAEQGAEPIGSMGDDTPWAALTEHYRPFHHFFRQNFAQVTNPPLDPIREERVMGLTTRIGNLVNVLDEAPLKDNVLVLPSPLLSNASFDLLMKEFVGKTHILDISYDSQEISLAEHLEDLRREAESAVNNGFVNLVITDARSDFENIPAPMVLAVAGIHNHLIYRGIRSKITLTVQAASVFDVHHVALLIGVGATVINPYLAEQTVYEMHSAGRLSEVSLQAAIENLYRSFDKGLLKTMSKSGISMVSAYRGGYHFEALGLSRSIVQDFFPGMPARISGLTLGGVERRFKKYLKTYNGELPVGGLYKLRSGSGTGHVPPKHRWTADGIHLLQTAVGKGSFTLYKRYTSDERARAPYNLRDLFDLESKKSIDIESVESKENIRMRFVSPGMSHGALSTEAHETLAIAANRMGAKSVSGEGGEDEERRRPRANGDLANSKVKQVASGRFGVTASYLNSCEEIEIKMAQGAKPGEGGQLPGFKVTAEIAKLRHTTPGTTLISPPPHHDIYSIEDLAQLIYDLKQINDRARVCVKLVAKSGIGTIAAGVAKAGADVISVSGHSGGTGASAQSSINHAGLPWELGLSEVHQILTLNRLRSRVTLRVDGGITTGRDVVLGALLGAEEFGIGTAALVAMGCLLVRQCQSNLCPVGICTQKPELRELFRGTPEKVVNLFNFIAEDTREYLSGLGFETLQDAIGRTDLIHSEANLFALDLNPMLLKFDSDDLPESRDFRNPVPKTLDDRVLDQVKPYFIDGKKVFVETEVENTDRSVGTKISGMVVRATDSGELKEKPIAGDLTLKLTGSAGQSLGAFATEAMKIVVVGDANDYVGKGLCGADIVLKPSTKSRFDARENTIAGNTVLYGATSGRFFAAGQCGERFAVRNSGALAVIEGCGSNGCEYMTGGNVIILGSVGENFAAGLTGGRVFVYDPHEQLIENLNPAAPATKSLGEDEKQWLKEVVEEHHVQTGSTLGKELVASWQSAVGKFKLIEVEQENV